MRLTLCILALALAGCRTAGPQVAIRDSHHINVSIPGSNTDANQGKTVPVKAISDLALSAAQTGNPTATMGDGGDQLADAAPPKADPAKPAVGPELVERAPSAESTPSTESTAPAAPGDSDSSAE